MRIKVLQLLLFVFIGFSAHSQIVINSIIANKTTGCAPENGITLTYDATGNIENISWDFGNGQSNVGSSTVSPTYTAPGTYTVTLQLSNSAGDSDTETLTITIFEKPVANFSATDTSGCVPLSVDFTDLSTSNGGNIVSWQWTFNDGTTTSPTIPNPSHTFSIEGTFPVVLLVVDDNGCADDTTITFSTSNPAVAAFSANPTFGCEPPLSVTFTDNSSSSYPLTYNWDFGDGNSSTDQNPVNTYSNYGTYTVNLTVTQSTGCQTTVSMPNLISIAPVVADFTMNDDSICAGTSAIFNASSTQIGNQYSWDFGTGVGFTTPSSSAGTSFNYATPGIYTVTLAATYNGGCGDTISKVILVDEVTSDFSVLNSYYSCDVPYTVNFGASSTSAFTIITDYTWNFGDGNVGTGNPASNTYNASGVYNVTLTTTNQSGCSDTKIIPQAVVINKLTPSINITSIPPVGERCIDMDVTFNNATSTGGIVSDPVISVTWDFADGVNTGAGSPTDNVTSPNTTGTFNSPTHTYTSHGDFTVSLTVQSDSGCVATATTMVEVGAKPQADFIVTPTELCASASVTFTDNSTDYDGNIYGSPGYLNDFWQWSNLNGDFQFGGSQDENIFQMAKDTGWMDVRLIVGYNNCYDTIDSSKVVFFRGPVVKNVAADPVDCSKPYERTYTADYIDTTSYFWVFGDGDTLKCYGNTGPVPAGTHGGRTSGTCASPTHVYQATGDYVVELLAWNGNNFPFDTDSCMYPADPITVK
ncbi:MAG: PKD domain-containing protein, partial [Bacteroidetes bacterium]